MKVRDQICVLEECSGLGLGCLGPANSSPNPALNIYRRSYHHEDGSSLPSTRAACLRLPFAEMEPFPKMEPQKRPFEHYNPAPKGL